MAVDSGSSSSATPLTAAIVAPSRSDGYSPLSACLSPIKVFAVTEPRARENPLTAPEVPASCSRPPSNRCPQTLQSRCVTWREPVRFFSSAPFGCDSTSSGSNGAVYFPLGSRRALPRASVYRWVSDQARGLSSRRRVPTRITTNSPLDCCAIAGRGERSRPSTKYSYRPC